MLNITNLKVFGQVQYNAFVINFHIKNPDQMITEQELGCHNKINHILESLTVSYKNATKLNNLIATSFYRLFKQQASLP